MEKVIRVFVEGTVFFINENNPYDLMAKRGNEIKLIEQIDDLIYSQRELRDIVNNSDFCDEYYLNIIFDTPAETLFNAVA